MDYWCSERRVQHFSMFFHLIILILLILLIISRLVSDLGALGSELRELKELKELKELNGKTLKSAVLYAQSTNNQLNFIGVEPSTLQKYCTVCSESQYFIGCTALLEGRGFKTNEIQ